MITGELLSYIENNLRKGFSDGEIKEKLLRVGWKMADIDEAFSVVKNRLGGQKKREVSEVKSDIKNEIKRPDLKQKIDTKRVPAKPDDGIIIYDDRQLKLKKLINHLILTALLLLVVTLAMYAYFIYYWPDSQILDLLFSRQTISQ